MMSRIRAVSRLAALAGFVALTAPVQLLIAGPLFKDYDAVPQFMLRGIRRIMGIRVEFNGVAVDRRSPMMYIANHVSYLDPLILGPHMKGAFVSKSEVEGWPLIGAFCKKIGSIFVIRYQNGKYIPEAQEQTAKILNGGRNVIVFPEAKVTDAQDIIRFRTGVLGIMFNNVSGVPLRNNDIRVQPFVIRETHVDGKPVDNDPTSLKSRFSWYSGQREIGDHFWDLLKSKSVRIELTGLPVMDPKNYSDREAFRDAAHEALRRGFKRPGP